jgi:cyclohexanecarboxyl-CoA dehydrogenase
VTPTLPPIRDVSLTDEIRGFVERHDPTSRSRQLDREPEFPRDVFRALGSANLLGLRTPRALGGRGLPLPEVGAALFRLAYHGGTVVAKLSLQPEFSSVLAEHGSPELVDGWFRPMVRGERLVGNQITEPGAGSDVHALSTVARRDGPGYVISGTKSEAAFAVDADAAIVYAKVGTAGRGDRVTAFFVPQDLPGIERTLDEPDLGEKWQRRGTVRYSEVRIPLDHRLGDEGDGFEYVRPELRRERALLAAIYLGVAHASWDETVAHVGQRRVFERPLAAQQGVSFALVEDEVALESSWLLLLEVLRRLESGDEHETGPALAKWQATETALRVLDHAIQFHGGRGYSSALPHEQRWRDVRSGRIAHGPSEVLLHLAARELWPERRTRE